MNKIITTNLGGFPLRLNDIEFIQNNISDILNYLNNSSNLTDTYILSGGVYDGNVTISEGILYRQHKLYRFDAYTMSSPLVLPMVILHDKQEYDSDGLKTFADLNVYNTYLLEYVYIDEINTGGATFNLGYDDEFGNYIRHYADIIGVDISNSTEATNAISDALTTNTSLMNDFAGGLTTNTANNILLQGLLNNNTNIDLLMGYITSYFNNTWIPLAYTTGFSAGTQTPLAYRVDPFGNVNIRGCVFSANQPDYAGKDVTGVDPVNGENGYHVVDIPAAIRPLTKFMNGIKQYANYFTAGITYPNCTAIILPSGDMNIFMEELPDNLNNQNYFINISYTLGY